MSNDSKEWEKQQREQEKERRKAEHEREKDEREREREQAKWERERDRDDWKRHERMSRASQPDPRDLNGDGHVTPAEAAAYIKDLLQTIPENERKDVLTEYFRTLGSGEQAAIGAAMEEHPASPAQKVDKSDPGSLADAYAKTANPTPTNQAAPANQNPLEQIFNRENAEQLVKAGLIGLATVLGSRALDQYRQKQAQQTQTPLHQQRNRPNQQHQLRPRQ